MDKLSELLKEAKPLYRKRQRRKTIAKLILCMSMPVIMMTSIYQVFIAGEEVYISLDNNSLQTQLLYDDFELL